MGCSSPQCSMAAAAPVALSHSSSQELAVSHPGHCRLQMTPGSHQRSGCRDQQEVGHASGHAAALALCGPHGGHFMGVCRRLGPRCARGCCVGRQAGLQLVCGSSSSCACGCGVCGAVRGVASSRRLISRSGRGQAAAVPASARPTYGRLSHAYQAEKACCCRGAGGARASRHGRISEQVPVSRPLGNFPVRSVRSGAGGGGREW